MEQAAMRAADARAQAASPKPLPRLFDIEKAAEGAWLAKARPAALINCNAAIFELSDGLLVVDTHSKPSAAAALIRQIGGGVSAKPVRWVVNSHFHWDHTQGVPAYKKAAPRADVVASEITRRLVSENGDSRLKASIETANKSLETYASNAAAAKSPDEKAYWVRMASETKAYVAEMKGFIFELPNVTLTKELIIHDKLQDLRVAFLGRAHTAGDVVVYSPSRKAVATGDMLQGLGPFIADGYPKEWGNTLISVAGLEFDKILGGHGRIHEPKLASQMRDYLEELWIAVERAQRTGQSLDALQKSLDASKFRTLSSEYGTTTVGVMREFTMVRPGTTDADLLNGLLQSNLADVWKRIGA
jgi:glyoxylase-like metal-dependent hydrolase (beta-lactamase superfamily II)